MNTEKNVWDYGELRVSENGRYLKNGSRPFFWLGDTAWLLFQKCTEEEAKLYLQNRKDKGFSVILATLIHTLNTDQVVWRDEMLFTPAYWDHAERIVNLAEKMGLYMALLPCWGSFVKNGMLTEEKALAYADFLAECFRDRPNVIWLLGGDVRGDDGTEIFCAFGRRMRELFPHCLIGFHPFGRTSSSLWFHTEPWLDINLFQSGHRRYDQKTLNSWDDNLGKEGNFGEDNWRYVLRDLARTPIKPVADAEPSYEQIMQGLHGPDEPYWQAWDVRRYAYWSVFAGAFGHTYGDNSVMQFFCAPAESGNFGVKEYWQDAIHHEGSSQMAHLKSLMESVDYQNGSANDGRLADGQGAQYERISVFEGPGFILCYDYLGREFALDLSDLSEKEIRAWWFDPACGVRSYAGRITGSVRTVFRPAPKYTNANDWVLILQYSDAE